MEIDYGQPFAATDWAAWDAEYAQSVVPEELIRPSGRRALAGPANWNAADELALEPWWKEPLWGDDPRLAGPFDENGHSIPYLEAEDEYFGAPL